MEHIPAICSMAFIWFFVVTIPGPNFVVVTQGSMTQSRKKGIFIALGVSAGAGIWASASLLGLNALFSHAGWLYDAIKILGGCYLVYMGLKTICHAFTQPAPLAQEPSAPGRPGAAFKKGLFTSFSNPKTAAFFGSLFISTLPGEATFCLHGAAVLIVVAISFAWYGFVACFFSFKKIQALYQKSKRLLDFMTGGLLSFLGVRIISHDLLSN